MYGTGLENVEGKGLAMAALVNEVVACWLVDCWCGCACLLSQADTVLPVPCLEPLVNGGSQHESGLVLSL